MLALSNFIFLAVFTRKPVYRHETPVITTETVSTFFVFTSLKLMPYIIFTLILLLLTLSFNSKILQSFEAINIKLYVSTSFDTRHPKNTFFNCPVIRFIFRHARLDRSRR